MVDQDALKRALQRARLLPMALLAASWLPVAANAQQLPVSEAGMTSPGDKGAQIYCFMRHSGNSHEVSWDAAYEVIKRQGSGLFRPSPRHGAVMITESVVQNPASFPNCGMYLGDLFPQEEQPAEAAAQTADGAMTRSERYGY